MDACVQTKQVQTHLQATGRHPAEGAYVAVALQMERLSVRLKTEISQ